MSRRKAHAGTTGVTLPFSVVDTSSTTGDGLAGLVYNSAGLVAQYRRQGQATWTTFTLTAGTLGTPSGSATAGTLVADGPVAGDYELAPPDNATASGARWVAFRLYGAANMAPVRVEFELDVVDYQSATSFMLGVNGMAPPVRWDQMVIDTGGRSAANVTYVGGSPIPAPSSPAVVPGVLIVDLRYANGSTATFPSVVPANLTQINASTAAALNLQAESEALQAAAVTNESPPPTTTTFNSSDPALASAAIVYNTSRVVWRSGANAPRAFAITGCSGTSVKALTVATMPFAPAVGDKFVVIT